MTNECPKGGQHDCKFGMCTATCRKCGQCFELDPVLQNTSAFESEY